METANIKPRDWTTFYEVIEDTADKTAVLTAKMLLECFGFLLYEKALNDLKADLAAHVENFIALEYKKGRAELQMQWQHTKHGKEYGYRYLAGLACIMLHHTFPHRAQHGSLEVISSAALDMWDAGCFKEALPMFGIDSIHNMRHAYLAMSLYNQIVKTLKL